MSRRHRRRNIRSSAAKVQALLGALLKALLALDFCLGYPPACPESPNFEEESSFHNALAGDEVAAGALFGYAPPLQGRHTLRTTSYLCTTCLDHYAYSTQIRSL